MIIIAPPIAFTRKATVSTGLSCGCHLQVVGAEAQVLPKFSDAHCFIFKVKVILPIIAILSWTFTYAPYTRALTQRFQAPQTMQISPKNRPKGILMALV